MTNILFIGGYGIKSVGDDAMLVAHFDGLRKRFDDLEATMACRHLDELKDYYESYGFHAIANLDHESREAASGRRFVGFNDGDHNDHLIELRIAVEECDLVVLGGGEVLLDISIGPMKGWISYFQLVVTLARFFDKPILFAGTSIAPLKKPEAIEGAKIICDNVSKLIMRDSRSPKIADGLGIKIRPEKLRVLPDMAMGLQPIHEKRVLDSTIGKLATRPRIGVALRCVYWEWTDAQWESFLEMMARSLDRIVDQLDASLLFIPHNYYGVDDIRLDDRFLNKTIAERMKHHERCVLMEDYVDVRKMLAVYEHLDLVLGMRHHGAVLGTRAGIPTLALTYAVKTKAFMEDAGLGQYVHSIDDATEDSIVEKTLELYQNRDDIRKHLKKEVKRQLDLWQGYIDEAAILIEKNRETLVSL